MAAPITILLVDDAPDSRVTQARCDLPALIGVEQALGVGFAQWPGGHQHPIDD